MSISFHLVTWILSFPSQKTPISAPLASQTTNTSRLVPPSSNRATASSHVPPVPTNTASPQKSLRSVDLSMVSLSFLYHPKVSNLCVSFQDSETETDFDPSVRISILFYFLLLMLSEIQDLYDTQHTNKKQKQGTETGKHNSEPCSTTSAH
jgi:hypothetical protein